jgi:hypothetical protein
MENWERDEVREDIYSIDCMNIVTIGRHNNTKLLYNQIILINTYLYLHTRLSNSYKYDKYVDREKRGKRYMRNVYMCNAFVQCGYVCAMLCMCAVLYVCYVCLSVYGG